MSFTRSGRPHIAAAPFRSALSRDNLIVGAALAAAAILAWVWLLQLPAAGAAEMAGMAMPVDPMSTDYLLPAFAMWANMMVAMMVPSAAPMILLHARIDKSPSQRARRLHSLLFALAYLLVWAAFSAAAAVAQALLVSAGALSAMALAMGDRALAGILLLIAACYELTAAKRVCLDRCQSPMIFLLQHRREGAFRLGIVHGLYCLGCCWALMLLLFVGGVMNLAWVAVLGIIVLGEKFAPPHWHVERYLAAALTIAALLILLPQG